MNYVSGIERSQLQIQSLDDFIEEDIEDIAFYLGDNDEIGRPKFDPRVYLNYFSKGTLTEEDLQES